MRDRSGTRRRRPRRARSRQGCGHVRTGARSGAPTGVVSVRVGVRVNPRIAGRRGRRARARSELILNRSHGRGRRRRRRAGCRRDTRCRRGACCGRGGGCRRGGARRRRRDGQGLRGDRPRPTCRRGRGGGGCRRTSAYGRGAHRFALAAPRNTGTASRAPSRVPVREQRAASTARGAAGIVVVARASRAMFGVAGAGRLARTRFFLVRRLCMRCGAHRQW